MIVLDNVIASGSSDKTKDYGKILIVHIQTLTKHIKTISSLIKVSDNVIACGSGDRVIRLWKETNGEYEHIQNLS